MIKYLGNLFRRKVIYKNRFRDEERCSHRTGDSSLKYTINAGKGKGKVHPRTGHEGPERE